MEYRQTDDGRDKRQRVGHRHAYPDAFQSPPLREEEQTGKQVEQLAGERKENAYLGFADALEEVADDNLRAYQREHHHGEAHTLRRQTDKILAVGEKGGNRTGKEFADKEAGAGDDNARKYSQTQRVLHPVCFPRPVVVADDGLHAHGESEHNHHIQRQQAVDDAVRADGHIAPVGLQAVVDDDDDDAGAYVDQKRRHADGEDVGNDAPFHTPYPPFEVHRALFVEEMAHHPYHPDELRYDGCRGRSAHSPSEPEDEEGSEDEVGEYRHHRREHRLLRVSRGAHHVVQPDHGVGHGRSQQNHLHEAAGVRQCLSAGAEEQQYAIEKNERHHAEENRVGDAKHQGVREDFGGSFVVFLSQTDGGDGGAARRNQGAESDDKVHHGEAHRQSGDGHGAYAVPDEDAVDDVVQ